MDSNPTRAKERSTDSINEGDTQDPIRALHFARAIVDKGVSEPF
jgi:hypothetical protein